MTAFPVTIDDVRAAAAIAGAVKRTPPHHSRTLSALTGAEIFLKFENLQFTASFKERGALNKLLSLSPEKRKRGVVAMSAGNHAQGVAYHAGRLGIPATIVMPEGTPFNKVKHTKDFGARVVIDGATLDRAFVRARAIAKDEHLTFVHPYDDPVVIAGQGTVALEMLEECRSRRAGRTHWRRRIDFRHRDRGEGDQAHNRNLWRGSARYPSMYDAVKNAALPCAGQTIAEGIAVKEPGALTRLIIEALVKDILLVREDEIERAIATLA